LVTAILTHPRFDPEELLKLQRQTRAEIAQVVDRDASVGQRFFVRKLFGDHPYGRPLKGTEASVDNVTIDDVREFFATRYTRSGVLIAAAGDITKERLGSYVERCLGGLAETTITPTIVMPPTPRKGIRLTLVDKPDRSQTQVFMGHTTLDANHADYFPLMVGQTVFGGTFTARLSHEIREKRGWSYGAYTYLSTDRHLGTLLTRFYPGVQDTVAAIKVADTMFCDLVRDGITADELGATKSYLKNGHVFSVDTPERKLSELVGARLVGRPDDFVDTYVDHIEAVTLDQVNAAMARHLTPNDMEWVVLGTASDLTESLAALSRVDVMETHDYRMPLDEIPY
jgi:zinc protease